MHFQHHFWAIKSESFVSEVSIRLSNKESQLITAFRCDSFQQCLLTQSFESAAFSQTFELLHG